MKQKYVETGINVYVRIARNCFNKIVSSYRKTKWKLVSIRKQKKMWLEWAILKQSWYMVDWMKMIFSDKSWIYIGQIDDAGTFAWYSSNETYKVSAWGKHDHISNSFMIWGCMSFKSPREIAIITSKVNTYLYIETLDNFLIPFNQFIWLWWNHFQVDNASCHK